MKTRSEIHEEKRLRRNRIIISIIMIVLMVFSTIAYAFYYFTGDEGSIRYNGHKIRANIVNGYIQGYTAKVDGQNIMFYSGPQDSLPIALPQGMIETLRQAEAIVILFDPADNQTLYYDAIRYDFSESIPKQQAGAVTQASDVYSALPVLSCADATPTYPFILLTKGNTTITAENGCYVLAADGAGFSLLRDRVVYAYHGITQE